MNIQEDSYDDTVASLAVPINPDQPSSSLSRDHTDQSKDNPYFNSHEEVSRYYDNNETLYRIRVILLFISTLHYGGDMFNYGWKWLPLNLKYLTFWGKSLVQFYLLWVVLFFPKTRRVSNATLIVQQSILICQTYIVVAYWVILAPLYGWAHVSKYENGIYPHVFPFLFVLYEYVATNGEYGVKGEIGGIGIILIYTVWNGYLKIWHDIDVYKTPNSDPRDWDWKEYISIIFRIGLIFLVGRGYRVLKNIIVSKRHEKLQKRIEEVERQVKGEERDNAL